MEVKVFKIDREKILVRLKKWAQSIGKERDVLAVILFGSFAKKEETPASDADILILLKESKEKFEERILRFIPRGLGISVDIFPYTLEEFRSSLKEKWGVAEEAMKNGIFLYKEKEVIWHR